MTKPLDARVVNLLKAADIIERDGWCRRVLENPDGAHCVVGALKMAQTGTINWPEDDDNNDVFPLGFRELRGYLKADPIYWNNAVATDGDEVAQVLRAVAMGLMSQAT